MVRVKDVVCCCFALLAVAIDGMAEAYGLSWLWGMGVPVTENPDRRGQIPGMLNDGVAVAANDLELNHPRNLHAVRRPVNETEARYYENIACSSDKMCGRGRFCDLHYGGCHRHRRPGHHCRRDGHCQKGYDCMFGICQQTIPEGTVGARCRHDKDCGDNMCCAKQHGESVCKRKLPLNAKCYIPPGGVQYVIDTLCPCETGLVCSETMVMERREQEFILQFWTDRDHMRCQVR